MKIEKTFLFCLLVLLATLRVRCRNFIADEETVVVGDGSDLVAKEHYGTITFQYTPVGWDQEELQFNIIEQNLDRLSIDDTKGRKLMVFPEYALTTIKVKDDRKAAFRLSQIVPSNGIILCDDAGDPEQDYLAVHRLSCLAQRLQIDLVANLVEKVACSATETNQPCGSDGVLLYNTNVAFDKDGRLLAKYRKFNLLQEPALNRTDSAEAVTFTTSFGVTFGLVTGHDLLFHKPAVELVNVHRVTHFVHPTAWVNTLPFKTGTQIQMGWSRTLKVNLVSSSYLHVEKGYSGAGVYRKDGTYRMAIGLETGGEPIIDFFDQEKGAVDLTMKSFHTESDALMAEFSSTLLLNNKTAETCHGKFCCQLEIEADFGDQDHFYQLLAFSGEDGAGIQIQACGLVACANAEVASCGNALDESEYATRVSFNSILLKGNFSSSHVIPSTLHSESTLPFSFRGQLARQWHENSGWLFGLALRQPIKVHTFALYSHDYRVSNNAAAAIPCLISLLCATVGLLV
ncbi:pantetheinase-like [Cloeon dipterum]|uniref:pantetheinase-like n=1 Tax=Cloeon dipterum TaxID=197152 RepID=UPI00321FD0F0